MGGSERDPGIAMLLSAVLPAGGQLYAQAFGSAVLVWAAYALFGAFWFLSASGADDFSDPDTAVKGTAAALMLLVLTWASSIWDAGKVAKKFNKRLAKNAATGPADSASGPAEAP